MTIETILDGLVIGEPTAFGGLTLFPLVGRVASVRGYVTLDEALRDRSVDVSELSASGSVPELRLENRGEEPLFLLDGEELIGAKQNRVLNLSVLAPARASMVIPVSCVEQGRWESGRTQFQGGSQVQFASGRARKLKKVSEHLRRGEGRHSDQGEVWSDIQKLFTRLKGGSRTQAMADAFASRAEEVERYVSVLRMAAGQTGVAFGLGGQVRGLDLFDSPLTLRYLFPKLVRSWALEAIAEGGGGDAPLPSDALESLLSEVRASRETRQSAVRLGEDVRLEGKAVSGAALIAFERCVHLAAFRN